MIVSCITDGLGNQLFQYAAGRSLSLLHNVPFKLDVRYFDYSSLPLTHKYYLNRFNLKQEFLNAKEIREYTGLSSGILHKAIRRICAKHQTNNSNYIYKERHFHYDSELKRAGTKLYLRGYWQSFKYFIEYEKIIRNDFSFLNLIDKSHDRFASKILTSNSVCISIRRGDYVSKEINRVTFFQCNADYFKKGLDIIASNEPDIHVFVFSDDIGWCERNISFEYPTTFVKAENVTYDYYLQLMTMCRYFVISNSTFSWWGAWLSEYCQKKVIAPKRWFNDPSINTDDLFPSDWIRI